MEPRIWGGNHKPSTIMWTDGWINGYFWLRTGPKGGIWDGLRLLYQGVPGSVFMTNAETP